MKADSRKELKFFFLKFNCAMECCESGIFIPDLGSKRRRILDPQQKFLYCEDTKNDVDSLSAGTRMINVFQKITVAFFILKVGRILPHTAHVFSVLLAP
jgi:hypothetical protein